ncbi:hypothetical protein [Rhodococcus sp. B50]|uniref:hypothetical protein n=1 Tax=Rhodococcus sp. B50 TaxID=2682847 RepID=UPI001BD4E739|nr:hypothetical protein [Rhodococcus sp. B50]
MSSAENGQLSGGRRLLAAAAFAPRPELSLPLAHPALADGGATAAHQLGYTIL